MSVYSWFWWLSFTWVCKSTSCCCIICFICSKLPLICRGCWSSCYSTNSCSTSISISWVITNYICCWLSTWRRTFPIVQTLIITSWSITISSNHRTSILNLCCRCSCCLIFFRIILIRRRNSCSLTCWIACVTRSNSIISIIVGRISWSSGRWRIIFCWNTNSSAISWGRTTSSRRIFCVRRIKTISCAFSWYSFNGWF